MLHLAEDGWGGGRLHELRRGLVAAFVQPR